MSNDTLETRLDKLEKELFRIKNLYEKALFYRTVDPEVSLAQARKSAEAICRQIYIYEQYEHAGKPANKLLLNDLIQMLSRNKSIPPHIIISLNTIQAFGNFGVHDQGDETQYINETYIKPCLGALSNVVGWYFNNYMKLMNANYCYIVNAAENNSAINLKADAFNTQNQTVEHVYKLAGLQIRDIFRFFKDTISIFSKSKSKFRLHFLRYDGVAARLYMSVQDEVYEDKEFEVNLSDGLGKGVIVCEAIDRERLVYRDLREDHFVMYKDSCIPEKLASVMAYPVRDKNKTIVGVIAIDSKRSFCDLGIDEDDLGELFIKLCSIIENILKTLEVST